MPDLAHRNKRFWLISICTFPRKVPNDTLIVEGYPVHESRFAGITVYATQVTTKALQAAKRKEQAAPVDGR